MNRILTMLLMLWFRLTPQPMRARSERGSVTTEHVLWAVAVIGIVAIVVAAVKAYVTSQAGNIS